MRHSQTSVAQQLRMYFQASGTFPTPPPGFRVSSGSRNWGAGSRVGGLQIGAQASSCECLRPSFDQSWARGLPCTASWIWGPLVPRRQTMAHRWLQSSAQGSAHFPLSSPQAPPRPGEMRWELCTGVCGNATELYGDSAR